MVVDEFIAKYGERGYLVLKAILEAARKGRRPFSLGDFNYKDVKIALKAMGIDYNPAPLLSKLEKEYGVIETSYKSSNQHWWRILDRELIEAVVREWEGKPEPDPEDPRVRMLRIQFYSLSPHEILDLLTRLSKRKRLTSMERAKLKKIAFEELPLLVDFIEKASSEYPDELSEEIAVAESILELFEEIVYGGASKARYSVKGRERLEDSLRYRDREPI
ncbi:MAG: hypothetical protein F7B19_04825 [Desulfurococcales archaeon]|nr:hypothetical protein [Desulfurococcales archaeon]